MPHTICYARDQLTAFALGKIPCEAAEQIAEHLDRCVACERVAAELDHSADSFLIELRQQAAWDPCLAEPEFRKAAETVAAMAQATELDQSREGEPGLDDPDHLEQIGQYRLLAKLGHGGMGAVYKAFHPKLKRLVAIKVLPRRRTDHPQAIPRFLREMEAVGRLDHPNIVRAYDAGESQGQHFLVMEYVDGQTMAQWITSGESLPMEDACHAIRQAALGLQHAHDHGLVHRDIKPSNLMRAKDGTIKLLDLGLAHFRLDQPGDEQAPAAAQRVAWSDTSITCTSQMLGTVRYMSPEQVSLPSKGLDHRTDIYSLGLTLYELVTGRPAFDDDHPQDVLRRIVEEGPPPPRSINPAIPHELEAILLRATARDPQDRYPTALAFADALEEYLRQRHAQGFATAEDSRAAFGPIRQRRIRLALWALVPAAACVLAVLAIRPYLWSGGKPETPSAAGELGDASASEPGDLASLYRSHTLDYRIWRTAEPQEVLRLIREPVYTWEQQRRLPQVGAVYLWLERSGRPVLVGAIFSWPEDDGTRTVCHEMRSLTPEPMLGAWRGLAPKRADCGSSWQPVPEKPIGQVSEATWPQELLVVAREFRGESIDRKNNTRTPLKLYEKPLYQYTVTDGGSPTRGALLSLCDQGDPEVILGIEARPTESGYRWYYVCARFSDYGLQVWYANQHVWATVEGQPIGWCTTIRGIRIPGPK